MRAAVVAALWLSGCGGCGLASDELDRAFIDDCLEPGGRPSSVTFTSSATVSALTDCGQGLRGSVLINVGGTRTVFGDSASPVFPNDSPEPTSRCVAPIFDGKPARAFWEQAKTGLEARAFAFQVTQQRVCGAATGPAHATIRISDWGQLDATVAVVEQALLDHDICSTVAISVEAPFSCVRSASAVR